MDGVTYKTENLWWRDLPGRLSLEGIVYLGPLEVAQFTVAALSVSSCMNEPGGDVVPVSACRKVFDGPVCVSDLMCDIVCLQERS